MLVENQMVEVKWNNSNKKHLISKGYIFSKIGDTLTIPIEDLNIGSKISVLAICDNCQEEFSRPMQQLHRRNQNHYFCSNSCQTTHSAKERLEKKPSKKCKNCKKEYKFAEHRRETTNFCSYSCVAQWQSRNTSGENSHFYVERFIVKCDSCGLNISKTKNKIEQSNYNFCNRKCQQKWHKEVLVKSEKFIENSRQTMLKNLAEGRIKTTETIPHLAINSILEKRSIRYKNEEIVGNYSLDIHLLDSNLFIEVNGGYWHCDTRLYKKIKFEHQLKKIINDKRKRTHLSNSLGKNILYLWEQDIIKNPEMCEALILKFIENKGILENYHSMNYNYKESKLSKVAELEIPYMEYNSEKLFSFVENDIRRKVTGYDETKHIVFNCMCCGAEKSQPISSYNKSKNHFCSAVCMKSYRSTKKKVI